MINWILSIIKFISPIIIEFINPERCRKLAILIIATIDYVQTQFDDLADLHKKYESALAFSRAAYDEVDEFSRLDDNVDHAVKNIILPFILQFIYCDRKPISIVSPINLKSVKGIDE